MIGDRSACAILTTRHPALLVGHLEEKQEGGLLDVVAVRLAVIAQDATVVPELLNELLGVVHWVISAIV